MKTTATLVLLGAASYAVAEPPGHSEIPPIAWWQLRGVECPTIRAASAALEGRLYLLGGLPHVLHGKREPTNELKELDPTTREWKQLDPCPIGVWGALMLADPNGNRLVALGGRDRAGVPTAKNILRVAVYAIGEAEWEAFEIEHDGIGQPTKAFNHDNKIVVLTEGPAAVVLVDLDQRRVISGTPCPEGLAVRDGVLVGGTVFVCGNKDHELWRCEIDQPGWRKVGLLAASQTIHESVLFTDGQHLLSWSPRESGARPDTAVWEINQDTGAETMLHRGHPGPSKRMASSICVGDGKLYACGGQASNGGWFQEIWVYSITAGQHFRDFNTRPDLKLDWAIEALADERITERWVWETLSQQRPSVIVDRLNALPDGQRRNIRWRLLCTLMGDTQADIAVFHSVPPQQLLEEVSGIWPTEIEPVALDGAYHWATRARSIAGPVVHDAVRLSVSDFDTDKAKLVHFETVRERVYLFEQVPPLQGSNCGFLDRGRMSFSADKVGGGSWSSREFGRAIPSGMKLPVIDLKNWVEFSNNAKIMPIEVQRLVPAGY
jgi:hypothetical protein